MVQQIICPHCGMSNDVDFTDKETVFKKSVVTRPYECCNCKKTIQLCPTGYKMLSMNFHKVFRFLLVVIALSSIIELSQLEEYYDSGYFAKSYFDACTYFVCLRLVFIVITFVGFLDDNRYSFYSLYLLLVTLTVENIWTATLTYSKILSPTFAENVYYGVNYTEIVSVVIYEILYFLVGIYYFKRRVVFLKKCIPCKKIKSFDVKEYVAKERKPLKVYIILSVVSVVVLFHLVLLLKYWFAPEAEYIITYDSVLISDNNVGHEWYIYVECDGERLRNGDSIIGKIGYDKELVVYVIEEDIYEDVGEEIVNIELGEHSLSKTIKVYPEENRGRYSGHQAEWEINLKIDFVKKMN